jgi:phosphoserine phosphatase
VARKIFYDSTTGFLKGKSSSTLLENYVRIHKFKLAYQDTCTNTVRIDYMHLVSDFDGVWTFPLAEATVIRQLIISRLAAAGQLSLSTVTAAFAAIEAEFHRRPFDFGWKFAGKITAFALEDLYGLNNAVAEVFWDGSIATIPHREELQIAIRQLAISAEDFANAVFRDGRQAFHQQGGVTLLPQAAAIMQEICQQGHRVTVVSNSKTDHIQQLFDQAGVDLATFTIIGGAQKFFLAPLEQLPAAWPWNGATINLQRPHYWDLLTRLQPDAVIGDVLSLDLALPLYLRTIDPQWADFRAGLIQQPYTPGWSYGPDSTTATAKGLTVLPDLTALPTWLANTNT